MDDVRTQLTDRLAELRSRGDRLEAHRRAPTDADSQERALAAEGDEVVERLTDAAREEIAGLVAALERMDAGTWGTCAICGDPIGEGRLRALPTATRCVVCSES